MTVKNVSNLAASVQARLQNHARATKRPFQELLQYWRELRATLATGRPVDKRRVRETRVSKTTRSDVAAHLRTPEEMAAYLEACLEAPGADAAFIAKAIGDIARAQGMSQVAREAR